MKRRGAFQWRSILAIGQLNYINALPFYAAHLSGAQPFEEELVPGHPAQLNQLLLEGKLDLSFASSAFYLQHRDRLRLVPGLCIAAKGRVDSVALYHRRPLEELQEVAVTPQSASSVALLQLLCEHVWKIAPKFSQLDGFDNDAFLLIGDQALQHPTFPGFKRVDLAQAWTEWTGLPMTFAVCVACKEGVDPLQEQLLQALDWGLNHMESVEQMAVETSSLPLSVVHNYYPLLRYRLGEEERQGFNRFAELLGVS